MRNSKELFRKDDITFFQLTTSVHKANSLILLSITRPPQIDTSEWLPKLLSPRVSRKIILIMLIEKLLLQIHYTITLIIYA